MPGKLKEFKRELDTYSKKRPKELNEIIKERNLPSCYGTYYDDVSKEALKEKGCIYLDNLGTPKSKCEYRTKNIGGCLFYSELEELLIISKELYSVLEKLSKN